ncbi:MAG: M56 family metallopeptidase [Bizionia sp.]|nr:M56 family metallopeptidase [Bizionia sp.]
MELLLLKSTACLALFIVFYKLVLEKETMHTVKRFYLLAALAFSIFIPFITFTEYVTVDKALPVFTAEGLPNLIVTTEQNELDPLNYLPYLLWSLYGLGVIVFGLKFAINLFKIKHRIANNPKYKTNYITHVLINDTVTPHTFLNYIFFNKTTFENNEIPQEIRLHEETHALQKHTIDILCIEFLIVLFWFNPLLYIIKKDIKLNHEFLADAGVLKRGVNASTYQNLLLAFSSGADYNPLANAINYSLIKKRFTVMKTQTPLHAKWLKSLLILPLLGGLLFSFSSTKTIKKENGIPTVSAEQNNYGSENNAITISEAQETLVTVNGIACEECFFNFSKKAIQKILIGTSTNDEITSFRVKFAGKPTETIKGSRTLNKVAIDYLEDALVGNTVQIFDIRTNTKVFPPVLITIVDKNDPNHTPSLKVKKGEHSILPPPPPAPPKVKQGELSNIPPPPPPPSPEKIINSLSGFSDYMLQTERNKDAIFYNDNKISANEAIALYKKYGKIDIVTKRINDNKFSVYLSKAKGNTSTITSQDHSNTSSAHYNTGFLNINGQEHFFVTINEKTRYYNRWGIEVDDEGREVNGSRRVSGDQVVPGQYLTKVYKENKIVSEFRKTWRDRRMDFPEMPKPKSPQETIKEMAEQNATFYYNGESITAEKALEIVNTKKKINMSSQSNNGVSVVHLSNKGMTLVNGKLITEDD